MPDPVSPLVAWANFYTILGSSAAALTGLMFVVVTLLPEGGSSTGESIAAFGTPTVVHFCMALLVSAVFCAPWPTLREAGWAVTLVGIAGLGYVVVVIRRARRQSEYDPVFEDWLWHTLLPIAGYLTLLLAGLFVHRAQTGALFAVGGANVLLLFIGIHNAWDTVTYLAMRRLQSQQATSDRPPDPGTQPGPRS